MDYNVTKRDGSTTPLNINKIHQVVAWACEGREAYPSQIEMKAHLQFYDGIKTSDIHKTLVKAAADLISEKSPDYQYVAANLAIIDLRKKAYGQFEPPKFYDHIQRLVEMGVYEDGILGSYSREEIEYLENFIEHDRDLNFAYAAVKQLEGKYLAKNRVTDDVYESPQMLYMLVSMCLHSDEIYTCRLEKAVNFYEQVSQGNISLPTPIMAGVRTPVKQFSSCCKIEVGDSLESITDSTKAIVKYISRKAGIGLNVGAIRALGSPIRNGDSEHTGLVPFIKMFQAAVKSCSQGSVRNGAATLFYPFWHLEVEDLLVLKNNKGTEDNRARHVDYGVQFNKLMYKRLIEGGDITLFSPDIYNGRLYEVFFSDQDEFEELYVKAENDPSIRKKTLKAVDLFTTFAIERAGTGRTYIQNVDLCNDYGPFDKELAPIRQSNLCMEIALPTIEMSDIDEEIALCTLAAFNLGNLKSLDDLEEMAEAIVGALDNLLDYQDYPMKAAEIGAKARRSLGVGVTNLAYYLAKNGVKYSDGSAVQLTHELFEAMQFYLLKASCKLAEEIGHCDWYNETDYSRGIIPCLDNYKIEGIPKYSGSIQESDWEDLRENIAEYGLRNSTLTCIMPSETSSQITNSTNGIEPPRGLISIKGSKDGLFKQVVPDIKNLKDSYELLWDIPDNTGYLNLVGVMSRYLCQAVSTNTNYDPENYPENKVPVKVILQDILTAYKLGIKNLYYHNTRDGSGEFEVEDDGCAGGACKI